MTARITIWSALLLAGLALESGAQDRGPRPQPPPQAGDRPVFRNRGAFPGHPGRPPGYGGGGDRRDGRKGRWPGGHMPRFIFDLAEKSPEEQDRFLKSSRRFNELAQQEQQFFRDKLKKLSAMTPEERLRIRERFEIFHKLPPESRDKIRDEVMPVWSRLAPERRQALLEELRVLRHMSPADRDQRLASDTFARQFSAEEQSLLRQIASLSAK